MTQAHSPSEHMPSPTQRQWPDALQSPTAAAVEALLATFWQLLRPLPDLVQRQEHLLADHLTTQARGVVIEMMLALNGIQWPTGTRHLNGYLGESQRAALEKTLLTPTVSPESWLGRAVALVVIYRWYAPQLIEKFALVYPQALEEEVWLLLQRDLPDWPVTVTTD